MSFFGPDQAAVLLTAAMNEPMSQAVGDDPMAVVSRHVLPIGFRHAAILFRYADQLHLIVQYHGGGLPEESLCQRVLDQFGPYVWRPGNVNVGEKCSTREFWAQV